MELLELVFLDEGCQFISVDVLFFHEEHQFYVVFGESVALFFEDFDLVLLDFGLLKGLDQLISEVLKLILETFVLFNPFYSF